MATAAVDPIAVIKRSQSKRGPASSRAVIPPAAMASASTASADHIDADVSRCDSFVRWDPLVSMPVRLCCNRLPAPVRNLNSGPRRHRSSNKLWVILVLARPPRGSGRRKRVGRPAVLWGPDSAHTFQQAIERASATRKCDGFLRFISQKYLIPLVANTIRLLYMYVTQKTPD